MKDINLKEIRNIHMIGIGGIGMSAIAKILQQIGYSVSGSDANKSDITKQLRKLGVKIVIGHSAKNVNDQDIVVYSSAITKTNSEIIEAKKQNIPIIRRAEFLGKLLELWPYTIGISGTHGKTTTSSIASIVFIEANYDPTFIIGGILKNVNTNSILGKGKYIIYEADEYDRTFLALPPTYSIITNIEMDHSDIYSDIEDMKKTFIEYANSTSKEGFVVLGIDDKNIRNIIPEIKSQIISYGFDKKADYQIQLSETQGQYSIFRIFYKNKLLDTFKLNALGIHNIKNASGVIALSHQLKIPIDKIKNGLIKYNGVKRRFEIKHEINNIIFIDDYAHHPSEIKATLKSTRLAYPNKRIIAIFQPHLYSRTRDFYEEFGKSLLIADVIVVTDIYPAREKPIKGVTSELIANIAIKPGHENVHYIPNKIKLEKYLPSIIKENDIIISLGAGDINKSLDKIYNNYKRNSNNR